jgi:hypothetical protein
MPEVCQSGKKGRNSIGFSYLYYRRRQAAALHKAAPACLCRKKSKILGLKKSEAIPRENTDGP